MTNFGGPVKHFYGRSAVANAGRSKLHKRLSIKLLENPIDGIVHLSDTALGELDPLTQALRLAGAFAACNFFNVFAASWARGRSAAEYARGSRG